MTITDLSGVIRWNANFVRGLAQGVLDRAKVIRSSLPGYTEASSVFPGGAQVQTAAATKTKTKARRKTSKAAPKPRRRAKKK